MKNRNRDKVSLKWIVILCIFSFALGTLFSNRIWDLPESEDQIMPIRRRPGNLAAISDDCATDKNMFLSHVIPWRHVRSLDSSIAKLRMELPSTKNSRKIGNFENFSTIAVHPGSTEKRKMTFMVIGINTAFSSRKRRDSVRETWMPRGTLAATLARHRSRPRIYIGCMKSGPVIYQKNVKYHEPEYWKFGEEGNKYFRHATGQIYAISKDLAKYISINQPILHKFANEDVSLGAWFIGLEVEHIDDHNMCCGTPPQCEWKAQAGNVCVASFDWSCSGICKSVERIKDVHAKCGEDAATLWNALF
ncbi:Beta-1 [Forsythia ovata]|uniref:Hexosyltransferase n=1 Tax=Forsythia ovata TaxID=205694 RepID=A0ABD1U848_9LAMI